MRIWFNRWFSTAYRMIELIKNNEDNMKFEFIGSHINSEVIYKQICDEWYEEPKKINSNDYVDWCLEFCKLHKIDILIPRRFLMEISRRKKEFEKINVKVLVEGNYKLLNILNNKVETSKLFKENNICNIPKFEVVNTVEKFKEKYENLSKLTNKLCFKYAIDEGAASFRVIENIEYNDETDVLSKRSRYKMSYLEAINLFEKVKKFNDLMLMEYIKGTEISIDCLNTNYGLIAIPRYKTNKKVEEIRYNEEVLDIVKRYIKVTNMKHVFNMQLIEFENKYYILEINPRMSGGIYLSSLTGDNIPYLAIRDLVNLPIKINTNVKNIDVTHLEQGLILN